MIHHIYISMHKVEDLFRNYFSKETSNFSVEKFSVEIFERILNGFPITKRSKQLYCINLLLFYDDIACQKKIKSPQ